MPAVPHRLMAEHLVAPLGTSVRRPRLSWWLPDGAARQEAFQIETSSGDSGRVDGTRHELVPYIHNRAQRGDLVVYGASFGAYHASNFAGRYPDIVSRAICFSGVYDIHSFTDGHWDDNCYFNCPVSYIANMNADLVGKLSRVNWVIATGEHDSLVQQNRDFSALLWSKGIPNHLEIWPGQFGHDWPWWREHLRRFV